MSISGPFESVGSGELPKFDMALDANAQGQGFRAGLTSTSDQLFVNFGGTSYEVPAQLLDQLKASYRRSQQEGSSDQQMSLEEPRARSAQLAAGPDRRGHRDDRRCRDRSHQLAGRRERAARRRRHDPRESQRAGRLPTGQQVPSRIPADARSQIEDAVKSASIDVWSGTGRPHAAQAHAGAEASTCRESSGGSTSLDVNLSIELTDLNQPQSIRRRRSSRPLNELLGQLQGLLGGALGGERARRPGSSGGAGGASSRSSRTTRPASREPASNVHRGAEVRRPAHAVAALT